MAEYEVTRQRHIPFAATRLADHSDRVRWSSFRLRTERTRRLRSLLHVAQTRSLWHRPRLSGVDIDHLDEDGLDDLPTMTKTDLMANFDNIVTDRRGALGQTFTRASRPVHRFPRHAAPRRNRGGPQSRERTNPDGVRIDAGPARSRGTGRTTYGDVTVHPNVFRSVLAREAGLVEYQMRRTASGADVRLRARQTITPEHTGRALEIELRRVGLAHPIVTATLVEHIDRAGVGKLKRFLPIQSRTRQLTVTARDEP
jgi:hypothetical protein